MIEAGSGYGKSVLATELRHRLGIASAAAELERDTDEPGQLVGALRRGLRRAGLSDIAAALVGSAAVDAAAALDRAPEAEPLDEDRYVRAAELLLFQGRRGSAQSLVDRATAVREELGLEQSPRLQRLHSGHARQLRTRRLNGGAPRLRFAPPHSRWTAVGRPARRIAACS